MYLLVNVLVARVLVIIEEHVEIDLFEWYFENHVEEPCRNEDNTLLIELDNITLVC